MLSIVSTPIGNLGDITLRAVEALKTCDAIVCEDTRVTGKLLMLLELPKKELIAAHSYARPGVIEGIIGRLQKNEHLCLVSDAGTPGISDPGFALISRVREAGLPMEVLPGASAVLAALSISGLPTNRFTYIGFLPLKKGRKTLLESLRDIEHTVVFYESPHRIIRTIDDLTQALAEQPDRKIVIARELTKMHEDVLTGTMGTIGGILEKSVIKGEFVVVLGPTGR